MPLTAAYDKMMDSKFADVKNAGSRDAGAITAPSFSSASFNKTPWAHLDIAGPAMGSPQNEISKGWSSGFGVRLLNRLVEDHYEGVEPAAAPAKASRPTKASRSTKAGGQGTKSAAVMPPSSEAVRDNTRRQRGAGQRGTRRNRRVAGI